MIEFSDLTFIETKGSYAAIKELMDTKVWMIRTESVVNTEMISAGFVLHAWQDGRMIIASTEHPCLANIPDDDIRELRQWCVDNGWQGPYLHKDLLSEQRDVDFWIRLYRAGVILSDELFQYEQEESKRLQNAGG